MDRKKLLEELTRPVPSARQLRQEEMEFYGFVHFTVNTFTGKEWGEGTESPSIFNPTDLDVEQWVAVAKDAGMKGLILTCKHHDGFCLWPSKYTEHSVKNSPYKDGKGDIVKEFTDACHKAGIKPGVYLSPWDRNSDKYGFGEPYNDYFVNQLTELLTQYGDIFTVWFDGACGEGSNGKKQIYDWNRYYDTIRKLQPEATISICGPDIRWCGNEAAHTRPYEWNVLPRRMSNYEQVAEKSQQADDEEFRKQPISKREEDLGSLEKLKDEEDFIWYPAEVDVSIRPGWFYHEEEDDQVRSFENLKDIYLRSVGGNTTLLLNLPPDKRGKIADPDVASLKKLGEFLRTAFVTNLAKEATFSGSEAVNGHNPENVKEDNYDTWYQPDIEKCEKPEICLSWDKPINPKYVVIKEQILHSQRISDFILTCVTADNQEHEYKGTTIGYKKIVALEEKEVKEIRIQFTDYRIRAEVSFIGVY